MQTAALALAKNDHALKFEPEVVRPKLDRPGTAMQYYEVVTGWVKQICK